MPVFRKYFKNIWRPLKQYSANKKFNLLQILKKKIYHNSSTCIITGKEICYKKS